MSNAISNYIRKVVRGETFPILGDTAQWKKVSELQVGTDILVTARRVVKDKKGISRRARNDTKEEVFWDEIVSIQKVGRERVYDIEVDGTHNFVANDILAHNTYVSGNVGIGVTAPTQALDVSGRIAMATWTADGDTAVYKDDTTGALGLQASDSRLKKNLSPITDALSKIEGITAYLYNSNDDIEGAKMRLGVLAQDVQKVVPEATFSFMGADGLEYYGVHYDKLSALLIAAMQEQQVASRQASRSIGTLRDDTLKAQDDITSIQGIITSLNSTTYQQKVDALTATLGEGAVRFATLEQDVASLKTDVQEISRQARTDTERVTSVSASFDTLNSEFVSLRDLVASNGALWAASSSGMLADRIATVSAITVKDNLQVDGKTTTFDLRVLNKLTSGAIEIGAGVDGNEINTSGSLRFQTLSQGPLDFMGGKVVIGIDGSVRAKKMSAGTISIQKDQGTIGQGIIKAGDETVQINTSAVSNTSRIFLTPLTKTNKPLFIIEAIEGSRFTVSLGEPATADTTFNWWIVEEE